MSKQGSMCINYVVNIVPSYALSIAIIDHVSPKYLEHRRERVWLHVSPDSKVHGDNMGPTWGRQDPGGPHVGPMNFAIWVDTLHTDYID